MGKIFYMMGKSSSGKDTVYKEIRKELPELKTLQLFDGSFQLPQQGIVRLDLPVDLAAVRDDSFAL